MKSQYYGIATVVALGSSLGSALELNTNDEVSIATAAAEVAKGLYVYHDPAATTGCFWQTEDWFWWLSGKGWTGLLDYMVYTNDTTYKTDFLDCMAINVGPNYDFLPPEQANWEANDDQMYWLYNALTAMEYGFEEMPCIPGPDGTTCLNSWFQIADNAFNIFVERWNADSGTCDGGLKWQFNPDANGYYYKNSVTNGGFFQTAARLARYTGNQTYADWATTVYDWTSSVGLVSAEFRVHDGTSDEGSDNCAELNHDEYSYNVATFLMGAANMYAYTGGDATWESRAQSFVDAATATFFGPSENATDIMYEQICEEQGTCTTDQTSFKSSMSRWMAKASVLVPSISGAVSTLLEASAVGAAASCSGHGNSTCGVRWYVGEFDGQSDFGTELSALEVISSLLIGSAPPLATLQ